VSAASYARQVEDKSLYETAQKIHGRAIKRCGELLKETKAAQGRRTDLELGSGDGPKLMLPPTRKEAAGKAEISKRQQRTALRVANIPAAEFEEMIERSPPATATGARAQRSSSIFIDLD
jgi:hypothetical protein